jgi:2-haloacid dehalogenase
MRTAYVHRPHEFGLRTVPPARDDAADLNVTSLTDLAAHLTPG